MLVRASSRRLNAAEEPTPPPPPKIATFTRRCGRRRTQPAPRRHASARAGSRGAGASRAGRRRAAQPDRALDHAVLAEDRVSVDRAADPVDQRRLQHVERPARERPQQLVAGGRARSRGGSACPRAGTPPRRVVPVGVGDRLRAARRSSRRSRSGRRGPRAAPRARSRASTSSISETLVGLEHRRDRLAELRAHPLVLGARDEDRRPRAPRRADQVRAREQAQRLAQRRPADAELGGELLPRSPGARPAAGPLRDVASDLEARPARCAFRSARTNRPVAA